MKPLALVLLGFIFFSSSIFASAKLQPSPKSRISYEPGVVVIKLRAQTYKLEKVDAMSVLSQLQAKYGVNAPERVFDLPATRRMMGAEELERIYVLRTATPTDIEVLTRRISSEPSIEYAEPHYFFPVDVIPNDSLYSLIYPLSIVRADTAWSIQKGDSTVLIGVIDSGVDWDHPDLATAVWTNKNEIPNNAIDDDGNGYIDDVRGWDFVSGAAGVWNGEDSTQEDNNPMDFDGHGSHVSGIAAGATDNVSGIASLGWGCRVMPLRCGWHGSDGLGYVSSLYASKAYVYAANNGASVCNQSSGTSEVILDGAMYAYKNGIVICNSAGNSNSEKIGLLGSQPWALSVAATNSDDNKASYSSFGSLVDISSPGGDFSSGNRQGFLSTVVNPSTFYGGKSYEYFQGTSMASPLVAALAGLVKSQHKNWTPAQIMFQIAGTADNIEAKNPTYGAKLGFGRINALRALTETPPSPKPNIQFVGFSVDDAVGGNGNTIVEPGEQAKIVVTIRNDWGDATNLTASLSTSHWTTTITQPNSSYGLVRGISNLDSAQRTNVSDAFEITVNANAVPSVIPFTLTISANGGYIKQVQFSVSIASRILLVDDDDGSVNVEQYYTSALQTIGTVRDIWDHLTQGTPPASVLQQYSLVIWSCEWAFPSLDSSDRKELTTYLNNGGKLFLSGQDIGWDLADLAGNEYFASGGQSKSFFENVLKAKYVADDAATAGLYGVVGDSVANGLTFECSQPFRASSEQYPDVIDTSGGSVISLRYAAGGYANKGGALLYSGKYRMVYFSFGGFEAITDSAIRINVMERLLKWLNGYTIKVDSLKDIENTSTSYPVSAEVTSKNTIQSVDLYWDNDGAFPFKKAAMSFTSGKYAADIPAQGAGTDVQYFVLVKTSDGYLPYIINKFHVGPDAIPPSVAFIDTIGNSIRLSGPYPVKITAIDNIGVDTTSVFLKYKVNSGSEQQLMLTHAGNIFSGAIVPSSPLTIGDVVSYYVTVSDISVAKNTARLPQLGFKTYTIGKEMVDNFENSTSNQWNLGNWGYSRDFASSGTWSITDSPLGNYPPGNENILELKNGYDLTATTKAMVQFYYKPRMHRSDTVFVELTNDGSTWTTFKKLTGTTGGTTFTQQQLLVDNFTGAGNANVRLRFKLKSDAATELDGLYVDDIEIFIGPLAVLGVGKESSRLPTEFALYQNYPNPFNPTTRIVFDVPNRAEVRIVLYDVLGREIQSLVHQRFEVGSYTVSFDASLLSSGVYYYRLTTGSFVQTKKMMVLK